MDEGENEEAADAVHKPERMYIYIYIYNLDFCLFENRFLFSRN